MHRVGISVLEEDVIQKAHLEMACYYGKQSVKSWAPYLHYYSAKRSETYRQYWDKGQIAGLIEASGPIKNRAAPRDR